jgi:hypothetical protein
MRHDRTCFNEPSVLFGFRVNDNPSLHAKNQPLAAGFDDGGGEGSRTLFRGNNARLKINVKSNPNSTGYGVKFGISRI